MKNKLNRLTIILSFLLLFISVRIMLAGVTGKVVGRVLDATTKEPLIGANVMIVGESIGAATDIDGYFIILNIRPGVYTIKAKMLGFGTKVVKNVTVYANRTTSVNFQLSDETLNLKEEVVIIAKKPPVQKDQTSTVNTITANDIESLPIAKTTSQFISLMPGVSLDGVNRIRGSDDPSVLSTGWNGGQGSSDVKTVIDGVLMNNYDGFNGVAKGSGGISNIPSSSVQEITVQAGAMPAEYGNANGGIISMYTKEGKNNYQGWFNYEYDLPGKKHWGTNVYDSPMLKNNAWKFIPEEDKNTKINPLTGKLFYVRDDYTSIAGQTFEGSFGGPVPFLSGVKFFISGRHEALAPEFPSVIDHGFIDGRGNFVSSSDNFLGIGNISFNISSKMKVKIGSIINQFTSYRSDYFDPYQGVNLVEGGIRNIDAYGKNIFLPKNWAAGGKQFNRDFVGFLRFTHVLSPTTFYNMVLGYSETNIDTIGVPLLTSENTRIGYFNAGREGAFWTVSDRKRWEVKFNLTSQVNKHNMVKLGFNGIFFNNYLTQYESTPTAGGRGTYRRRYIFYGSGPGANGLNKPVKPIQLAMYLQDKLEFEGLIINVGGRLDYFNPNSKEVFHPGLLRSTMYSTLTRANNAPTEDMPTIFTFSPRLGIAHPISDRAVIHFSTGIFRQLPDFYWFYGKAYGSRTAIDDDLNGNGKIDPAEKYNTFRPAFGSYFGRQAGIIRPEKSINFEVGADYNFYEDYTVSTVMYYKSETDQFYMFSNAGLGGRLDELKQIASNDNWFATLSNGAWGDTRGVEFSVRKRFSNYFSFSAAYNMEWAQSVAAGRSNGDLIIYAGPSFFYSSKNYNNDDWYKGNYVFYDKFKVDEETGAEIPVKPTDAEMDEWADLYANEIKIRKSRDWGYYANAWLDPLRKAEGRAGEAGLFVSRSGAYEAPLNQYKKGNPGSYGKFSFVFALPEDFKLGPNWLSSILSNVSLNYVYKMSTGTDFYYRPVGAHTKEIRTLPMYTNSDISLSKTFNTFVNATLYVDVMNIFNQQDAREVNSRTEYIKYGLLTAKPNNRYFVKYGDTGELYRYFGNPRSVRVGVRVQF